jgi:hypothetical protein
LLLTVVCLMWGFLLTRVGKTSVFLVVGPFSVLVTVISVYSGVRLGTGLRCKVSTAIALGIGSGAVMTLATYPAFRILSMHFAWLPHQVSALYLLTRGASPLGTFFWTACILTAEEYLWRGAYFDSLRVHCNDFTAAAICVGAYALVQFGTGSALVPLVALLCGLAWMSLRWATGSILTPLLSHAVWTSIVLLYHPLV